MTFSTSPCLFTGRLNYVSPRFTLPQPKDQNTRTRYVRHIILEHVNRPDERLSAYLLGDMAEYFPFSVGDILEANLRFNLLIGEHASHTQIFASLRGIVVE